MELKSPSKSDYLRAAAIVKKVADKNYSVRRLFNLYRAGIRVDKRKYTNIFRLGSMNFDSKIVSLWESALRKQKYRSGKNKTMAKPVRHRPARKQKLNNVADNLKKRGMMVDTIKLILKNEFFEGHKGSNEKALMVDHLFLIVETNPRARYLRIKRIMTLNHGPDDGPWVRIIWDYLRQKRAKRQSLKLDQKFFPHKYKR